MNTFPFRRPGPNASWLPLLAAGLLFPAAAPAQIVVSGNESKIDITSGGPKVVANAPPDTLSILDFSEFPPKVTTLADVPNSVVGPPSNIAISPDGKLALVANSLKLDPAAAAGWVPEAFVHVVELGPTPKLVGRAATGLQPSGLSFTPDGRFALVADRTAGTVTVLAVDGTKVTPAQTVKVCEPADSISDVAISPDGRLALASMQKGGYLAALSIDAAGKVAATGQKISVAGQPYRVVITPDGELALTAGAGTGNGVDADAMTVVDLKTSPRPKAIDYVPVGAVPESLDVSPDGRLAAVVVMDGSNLGPDNPLHADPAAVVLLERRGRTFARVQRVPVGRITEGVAFTGDGKYLVVQCHPDRNLWVLRVTADHRVEDTGQRVTVPGMPSSIRAAAARR